MEPFKMRFQRYDAGQRRIAEHASRHRVVRCGRRRGKTTFGEILTCHEAMKPQYIGWFVPRSKLLAEVWRNLRHRLAPIITKANDADHRIELLTGAVIEAWTLEANPDAGRSRKYHLAIVDECGLISGMKRWWDSALEATLIDFEGRALMLGTPHTISPDFDEFYDRAAADESGQWAAFTETTFDNPHLPPSELARVMAKKGEMPEWLWNQEYLAIPADGASGFFPRSIIKAHKEANGCDPVRRGDIVVDAPNETEAAIVLEKRDVARIKWVDDPRGPWKLWTDLDGERPPQDAAWCAGIDIGAGVGAANSVISVGDADTGCKWAEYAAAGVTPERLAPAAAAAGIWFGGRKRNTLIQFEVNGPGEVFIRTLLRLKYPMILGHQIDPGDLSHTPSDYGWRSSDQTKNTLLADYRGALAHGKYRNPSEDALNECFTYRFAKSGRLVSIADDANTMDEARVPHGDRCFVAGTMVLTPSGERPIETMRSGDLVITRDGPKPVVVAAETGAQEVVEASLSNGRRLVGTASHPIWTVNRGWVKLDGLEITDTLLPCPDTRTSRAAPSDVGCVCCTGIRSRGLRVVYNLSVAECPEYFANGVLVHNCIADALLWDAMKRVPLLKVPEWMPEDKSSLAYRYLKAAREKKAKKRLAY